MITKSLVLTGSFALLAATLSMAPASAADRSDSGSMSGSSDSGVTGNGSSLNGAASDSMSGSDYSVNGSTPDAGGAGSTSGSESGTGSVDQSGPASSDSEATPSPVPPANDASTGDKAQGY